MLATAGGPLRRIRRASALCLCAVVVLSSAAGLGGSEGRLGVGPLDVVDGALTFSNVQHVTGQGFFDTYCQNPDPQAACAAPVGVAYFAPNGLVVLTQEQWVGHVLQVNQSAIVEVDPATLTNVTSLSVNCEPGDPLYPGTGSVVWIPCFNSAWADNETLLGYNGFSHSIAYNVSLPGAPFAMAYDSVNGDIVASTRLWSAPGPFIEEYDPTNGSVDTTSAPGLALYGPAWSGPSLAFDPLSGEVLYGATNNTLAGLYVDSGRTATVLDVASQVSALAVDPASEQVLVAESNASTVLVVNARDFTVEAQVAIPNCIENACFAPDTVTQLLIDPVHGDAYLVAPLETVALNLTTLSVVGGEVGYGDGPPVTATYSPAWDRIFGTYEIIPQDGPGFLEQLQHGSTLELTSLLWLPPELGSLAIAVGVGVTFGVIRMRGPRIPPRERVPRRSRDVYPPFD